MPGGIKCRGRTGSGGPNECGTYFCRLRSAYFLHPRPRSSCHLRSSESCTNPYSECPPAACFGAPPLREIDPQRSCKYRIQQCLGEWCPRISQRICQSALEKTFWTRKLFAWPPERSMSKTRKSEPGTITSCSFSLGTLTYSVSPGFASFRSNVIRFTVRSSFIA